MLDRLKNDFMLSIITLLAITAILGISPFAAMRFLQGNMLAGIVDLSIMAAIMTGTAYAWLTGDTVRTGLAMAFVVCSGAVTISVVVGAAGIFWVAPCLMVSFFLAKPIYAIAINLSSVAVLMIHGGALSSNAEMWSFTATSIMVSICAFVFAYRNEYQREMLEQLATIDPLTGIKNRRSMDEELALAIASASRHRSSYALVLLDIDHFKKVNDKYGHKVGDDVLVKMATLIQRNTRNSDRFFRYGGEEFVLLLHGTDKAGLEALIQKLQHAIRKVLRHPGGPITVSFGVATLKNGENQDNWLARADSALYQAKENGRDRIVYADGQ